MHFHPFGIPLDEAIIVVVNAMQTPPSVYVEMARQAFARFRARSKVAR